ncbi:MAG: hypothetical protein CM15mP120_22690 [Pseudomonadota bacterium]|nr:MAG: hypothetical protein CM15mP120_22690 [Pseudomonadota bacterium]
MVTYSLVLAFKADFRVSIIANACMGVISLGLALRSTPTTSSITGSVVGSGTEGTAANKSSWWGCRLARSKLREALSGYGQYRIR